MASVPLSKDIIQQILPISTLDNLDTNTNDIQNDIDYLLFWLQPYFPKEGAKFEEPTPRVRSAIRSCLKDESSQNEFIRLYVNSVNDAFKNYFSVNDHHIAASIQKIVDIQNYYNSYISYLGLYPLPKQLFYRSLNTLFRNYIVLESGMLEKLSLFLSGYVFQSNDKHTKGILRLLLSLNLDDYVHSIIVEYSIEKIKSFVNDFCALKWNLPVLSDIDGFIERELQPTFAILLKMANDKSYGLEDLRKIAYDELVALRVKEIFQIILNYPDSEVCLKELHHCISYGASYINHSENEKATNLLKTGNPTLLSNLLTTQSFQRMKLVDVFIEQCFERLLHSGSNTIDVITSYIKTIKSFLIIDPKGVLLDKVVRPIRRYLKTREDIIIKLVHGLLDEDGSNELIGLAKELRKSVHHEQIKQKKMIDELLGINWVPDPIDALPDFKKGKVSDTIESLISIFDSKDIFINEFTKLFGERLVNLHNYDVATIEEQIQLLKLRFGKNEFTMLDIMIRDVKESSRVNDALHIIQPKSKIKFHSTILSHLYWQLITDSIPENNNFTLPKLISNEFETYSNKYTKYKKGRRLELIPSLGEVKLELIFDGKRLNYDVSTDKAAIISQFSEINSELSLATIASNLNMLPYIASQGLQFWTKEGILLEVEKDLYMSNENGGNKFQLPEEDELRTMDSTSKSFTNDLIPEKNENLETLYTYIHSLLFNLGRLPIVRIKELLSLTIPKDKLNTLNYLEIDLEEYLDSLVDDKKLELKNDCYNLKK